MKKLKVFILVWAFSFFLASLVSAQQTERRPRVPGESTQSSRVLPPARWIPERDFEQRHIKLDLRFDWERQQALGTAEITFASLVKDLRRVEFDAANMTISEVKLDSGVRLSYEATKEKISIELDHAYQPGDEITVIIAYHTNGASNETSVFGSFRSRRILVHHVPSRIAFMIDMVEEFGIETKKRDIGISRGHAWNAHALIPLDRRPPGQILSLQYFFSPLNFKPYTEIVVSLQRFRSILLKIRSSFFRRAGNIIKPVISFPASRSLPFRSPYKQRRPSSRTGYAPVS